MESENTLFLKIYKQSLLSSQELIELRKLLFGLKREKQK